MNLARLLGVVGVCVAVMVGDAVAADPAGPPKLGVDRDGLPIEITDFEGVQSALFRDGRIFLAGQPTEDAFARFKELGVTAVVNLRTPREMENRERIPFDEPAVIEKLGMEYVFIPLGGDDHPYSPAAVTRFAEVLEKHDGPVLLHCTVAWRASYMWAAYLVVEHGWALDDAMARGEAVAISPPPIEGLLGKPLKLAFE